MDINTGALIKSLRRQDVSHNSFQTGLAMWTARHLGTISHMTPLLLNAVDWFHGILGPKPLEIISKGLNTVTRNFVPVWTPWMPKVCLPLRPALFGRPGFYPGVPVSPVAFLLSTRAANSGAVLLDTADVCCPPGQDLADPRPL